MPRKTCLLDAIAGILAAGFNEAAARCRGKPEAGNVSMVEGGWLQ